MQPVGKDPTFHLLRRDAPGATAFARALAQVWNHWRKVASVLGPGNLARELASVEKLLSEDDGKNYHAWAHR